MVRFCCPGFVGDDLQHRSSGVRLAIDHRCQRMDVLVTDRMGDIALAVVA